MTGWVEAAPAILAATAILMLPGLAVTLAAGLRGIPALGMAPPLSVTIVALTAVAAARVDVPFGVAPVAVVAAGAVVVAHLTSRLLFGGSRRADRGWATTAGALGVVIGGACAAAAVVRGVGQPTVFPQTFDAVFHLSAVWHVLQTGDASSLTLGSVAAPGRATAFYPAAWHGVTALVVLVSGAKVVVAANAVSLAIAALVWPFGCLLLARQVVGARPVPLCAAGVLSGAFSASPFLLLSYGTLWPNALACALLPALLSCAVSVLRPGGSSSAQDDFDRRGRPRPAVLAVAALPGIALAHPNAVLSAMLYLTVMAVVSLGRWGLGAPRAAQRWLWAAAPAVLMLAAEVWFVTRSPVFAATRRTSWPARQSLAQAAGEWLLSAPQRTPVPWLAAALVLAGCIAAWRRRDLQWLVLAHAGAGAAFVLVAGSDGPVARALSGPWYDDAFRFAALLGVTAVPLAALGVERVTTVVVGAVGRVTPHLGALAPRVVIGSAVLAVAAMAGGMEASANGRVVGTWYHGQSLAGPAERSLLEGLPRTVPPGVRIAGNPWNGSPLASPLGDREAVFPHLSGTWDPDRTLLASSLNRAEQLPAVCAAVERLDVGYVIDGPIAFWKGDRRQARYPGLEVAGHPGFEPVAHGGRLTLYRVTACS